MKKSTRLLPLLLGSLFVFAGCNPSSQGQENPPKEEGYFKFVADKIASGPKEESYQMFYDGEANRFYVELYYDLHFGLAIKIEEYDLWNNLFHANEGTISDDYETITLTNSAHEKSELFSKGTYVLSHSVSNNKDNFKLTATDKEYSLTTTVKEEPHYIYKDLVGEFEYQESGEAKFTMAVTVGAKKDGYPVTIKMAEGDKHFNGSNIQNSGTSTSFDLSGVFDGEYLKTINNLNFSYSENNDSFRLTIGNAVYPMTKTKGMDDDDTTSNYFVDNAEKVKFSCNDFEATLGSASNGFIQVAFKELVDGGNQNIRCFFEATENDSLVNMQSITNKNNKVFVNHTKYELKHSVVAGVDKVDIYFDDVLAYENLTIIPINE